MTRQTCKHRIPSGWPETVSSAVSAALESGRTSAVRHSIQLVDALPDAVRGRGLTIAVARTFTIEPQLDTLKLALATLPCRPNIRVGNLNNVEQELLDPGSSLLAANPDAVLVLWRLEELHEGLVSEYGRWSAEERARAADDVVARIRELCSGFARASSAPLFLSTLPPVRCGRDLSDVHRTDGIEATRYRVNREILDMAAQSRQIHVFDFAGWAALEGRSAFDLKMDLYAQQPISAGALSSFADALRRTLRPIVRPRAKVLALDLDNTLWGGVLGEDGVENLKVGRDYPGNVYLRIQRAVLALKNEGVLLALVSKNNAADVEEAFSRISSLQLSLSDFAAARVNWRSKHENLVEIAEELNVGTDSFVFVDDQAFEREEVAFHLPEVCVLDVTEDPLSILRAILDSDAFDSFRISDEDRGRAADYAAHRERKHLHEQSVSTDAFLGSLKLEATIVDIGDDSLPRVVQMLGKTNQFNVTTRRHAEAKVRAICATPGTAALTLALRDRFGDQGIVGVLLACPGDSTETLHVDSFLLSCRALGRGAELALWSELLRRASANGFRRLTAEYIASAKNAQVADLYDRLGMVRLREDANRCSYELSLPSSAPMPGWIAVNETVEK